LKVKCVREIFESGKCRILHNQDYTIYRSLHCLDGWLQGTGPMSQTCENKFGEKFVENPLNSGCFDGCFGDETIISTTIIQTQRARM
jgi:hypothetical protein